MESASPAPCAANCRGRWLGCVLLIAAALVGFHRLTWHPSDLLVGPQRGGGNDVTLYFLAARDLPARLASAFRQPPWWNPHVLGGTPWLGNPQAGLCYPPYWLAALLGAERTVSWLIVGHHLLGGFGVWCLSRHLGRSPESSVAAGALFVLAPFVVAQTGEGHVSQVCLSAWLPWAFLAWERLSDGPRRRIAELAGVLTLAFFCGHVQEWFYLVLLLSMLTVVRALRTWRVESHGRTLLRRWVLAGVLTTGLVAVELVPTWYVTQHTVRRGRFSVEEASATSVDLRHLRQLVQPFALGRPESTTTESARFYWETVCYFGAVALGLAIVGATRHRDGSDDGDVMAAARYRAVAVFALMFSFGAGSPVYALFHRCVPGVATFRVPSRMLFFASLAVAVLAAFGLDRLWRRGRAWSLVLAVVAFGELTWHAHHVLRTIPRASLRQGGPLAELLTSQSAAATRPRVLVPQSLLSDREAIAAGLDKLQGYEPVTLLSYFAVLQALAPGVDPATATYGFEALDIAKLHRPLVDLTGTRFAVVAGRAESAPPGWTLIGRGAQPVAFALRGVPVRTVPLVVYENPAALPRAFVVGAVRKLSPGENVVTALTELDPRREVLLDVDPLPPGPRADFRPASIARYTANHVAVDVATDRPGYVVLSDVWFPGWEAFVDGQPAPNLRANVAFRAVPVTAGAHRVEWRYRPRGAAVGLLASVIAAVAWGLVFAQRK